MREIKFRYRIKNRKYGKIHKIIIDLNVLESGRQAEYFNILDYEILSRDLYIGLNAKNGEIYEGDIIRWYPQKTKNYIDNIVEYIGNKFSLGDWYEDDYPNPEEECKIIGNIYENPELLKKEK